MNKHEMDDLGKEEVRIFNCEFMTAVRNGRLEIVRSIASKPDFELNEQRDEVGGSALHVAVDCDDLEMAKLLKEIGLDARLTDNKGHFAMHYACGPLTSPNLYQFLNDWTFPEFVRKTDSEYNAKAKIIPFAPKAPTP